MKRFLKILAVPLCAAALFVLLYALALLALTLRSDLTVIDPGTPAEDAADWMAALPDGTPLSAINMPGTHDTATKNTPYHYAFQCQSTTVTEQLLMGCRFADIRLTETEDADGNAVQCLMHGVGHCRNEDGSYMLVTDFTRACFEFLDAHPTECVIVLVDVARDRGKNAARTAALLQRTLDAQADRWYVKNAIPTLGEVRGKLILATRYGDVRGLGDDRCGLDLRWRGQGSRTPPEEACVRYELNGSGDSFVVQNRTGLLPDDKWNAVLEGLAGNFADEDTLMLNYLPVSRGFLWVPCPKLRAVGLNDRFLACELPAGCACGIVLFDFVTAGLAEKVYRTNFYK